MMDASETSPRAFRETKYVMTSVPTSPRTREPTPVPIVHATPRTASIRIERRWTARIVVRGSSEARRADAGDRTLGEHTRRLHGARPQTRRDRPQRHQVARLEREIPLVAGRAPQEVVLAQTGVDARADR